MLAINIHKTQTRWPGWQVRYPKKDFPYRQGALTTKLLPDTSALLSAAARRTTSPVSQLDYWKLLRTNGI